MKLVSVSWKLDCGRLRSLGSLSGIRILYLVGIPEEFRSGSRNRFTRVDQVGFPVYPGVSVSPQLVSVSGKLDCEISKSFGSLSEF